MLVCCVTCVGRVDYGRRFFVFFFFKQKTAYEMRISDWSSDVCSSDLAERPAVIDAAVGKGVAGLRRADAHPAMRANVQRYVDLTAGGARYDDLIVAKVAHNIVAGLRDFGVMRSEEHTSELQSLMRISYAVFCLKKKINKNKKTKTN